MVLPLPGGHHQVDRVGRAAAQDRVQLLVAAGQAPASPTRPSRAAASGATKKRAGAEQVLDGRDSCSGSSGFAERVRAASISITGVQGRDGQDRGVAALLELPAAPVRCRPR